MSRKASDNPEISYEYLFTIKEENVRVYRFMDGGYKYIAVKEYGDVQPIFEVKEGKTEVQNTIHPVEKRTLEPKWKQLL